LTRDDLFYYGARISKVRCLTLAARGGRRPGAGRKPGSGWKTKIGHLRDETIARMTSIVASDKDPLTVIVDMVLDDQLSTELRLNAASIALPFIYPKLSAVTVDQRTTTVKIDGNALIEKLNSQIERLAELPTAVAVIEAAVTEQEAAA
jgi:hypothetical protein